MCTIDTRQFAIGDHVVYQAEGATPCHGIVAATRWLAPHDCTIPQAIKRYQRVEVVHNPGVRCMFHDGTVQTVHLTEAAAAFFSHDYTT